MLTTENDYVIVQPTIRAIGTTTRVKAWVVKGRGYRLIVRQARNSNKLSRRSQGKGFPLAYSVGTVNSYRKVIRLTHDYWGSNLAPKFYDVQLGQKRSTCLTIQNMLSPKFHRPEEGVL